MFNILETLVLLRFSVIYNFKTFHTTKTELKCFFKNFDDFCYCYLHPSIYFNVFQVPAQTFLIFGGQYLSSNVLSKPDACKSFVSGRKFQKINHLIAYNTEFVKLSYF